VPFAATKVACISIPALNLPLTTTRDAVQVSKRIRIYIEGVSREAKARRNSAGPLHVATAGLTHTDRTVEDPALSATWEVVLALFEEIFVKA
jgi:hypothetical protein